MAKNIQKLKQIFANDPEMLRILEQRELGNMLEKVLEASSKEVSIKGITMIKGDPGEPGKTPEKYVDYFTPEEIIQIVDHIKEEVAEQVRPVKGVDYFDGQDAVVDEEQIVKKVLRRLPPVKEVNEQKIVERVIRQIDLPQPDEEGIVTRVLENIPAQLTVDEVVDEIRKKKLIDMRDIKNMPLNMNDMRWHGGGLSTVAHDDSLTGDGTPSSPLSVVGFDDPVTSVNGQTGDVNLGVSDLTDVDLDNIQVGDILVWDGVNWVNQPESGGGSDTWVQDDLTDEVDGVTDTFTLTAMPKVGSPYMVYLSGVRQRPTYYSVTGDQLVFTFVPPQGTELLVDFIQA
jgi:hypothetical protein